jgi:hypothetical protein
METETVVIGSNRTAAAERPSAAVIQTFANKVRLAFGLSNLDDAAVLHRALAGRRLNEETLRMIGISPNLLKGLTKYGINIDWDNISITEADLDKIIEKRTAALNSFKLMLRGSGKSEEQIENLFNELWRLAARGKLEMSDWNSLVEKYGFKELKLKSSSTFKALLKGIGYENNSKVECMAEFLNVISNMILNMKKDLPNSTSPEKTEEQIKGYYRLLVELCQTTHFNIIKIEEWDKTTLQMLDKIDPGLSKLSYSEIMNKIKNSKDPKFESLKKLLKGTESWKEFIVKLFRAMEESVANGIPTVIRQSFRGNEEYSKRMERIKTALGKPGTKAYENLVQQLSKILGGQQAVFNFEEFEKAGG